MSRLLCLAAVAALAACDSPEASRARGSGAGADVGNRGDVVLMHEGSKPYADTPRLVATQPVPVEGANHADWLSRR